MLEVTTKKNSYIYHIKIFIEICKANFFFLRVKYIGTVQESSAQKRKSVWCDSDCRL